MMEINVSVAIKKPAPEVFESLTDVSHWPEWASNVVSMELVSGKPLQIGSRFRQVTRFGNKENEAFVEVTQWIPDQAFGFKGPNSNTVFTLTSLQKGTRLTGQFEGEATGITRLFYGVFLKLFAQQDLNRFKAMAEAGRLKESLQN